MQRYRFVMARLWLYNAETDPAIVDEIAERYAARSGFNTRQAVEISLKAVLIAIADDRANRFRRILLPRRKGSIFFKRARATLMPSEAPIRAPLWE